MGKIKVYELAKELNINNKELIEKLKNMGVEVKSHLSTVEDKYVEEIRNSIKGETNKNKSTKSDKKQEAEEKKTGPVIIRRAVILEDENATKPEEPTKNVKREGVGTVEKRKNKDFNIVYREKPTKPLNIGELFGKKKPEKKEFKK